MIHIVRYFIFLIIFFSAFSLGALFFLYNYHWIDFSALEQYKPGRPSMLLDDNGKEWARYALDRREPVMLEHMPHHLIQAFLAAEDWDFFNHRGLSYKGIIRSLFVNIYHGRRVQGASTITQQLVKLLFFDSKKTFSRKIKEQLCALQVEQQFTKEQILEAYLNHIYFGCGIYGVEAASQRFWGKSVSCIRIDEAAVLAAIVCSPANYCPLLCPLSAERRRNLILSKMHTLGFITQQEYDEAHQLPLSIKENNHEPVRAQHLKETLRLFLEELVGKAALYSGGLVIQTTLNITNQAEAEKAFIDQCKRLKKDISPDVDGGLIAMDVKTGEIKAMIGGFDYVSSKFNRAVQAHRQMGSIFKPIIYAAALQSGFNFANTAIDEPIEVMQNQKMWCPNNFNNKFNGQITLAYALSHSNNIVTIKTLLNIGFKKVIDLAKRCRLQGPFYEYPSLALGCVDATLQEVIGMMNVFANDGVYVEPHCISWVKDQWGNKIWKCNPQKERVMHARICGQVAKVLELGLQRVHKWYKNEWINSQALYKTGTTNESRTCWFIGSTPTLTTAVYIGCDDNRSMGKNVYPIRTAFPIWLSFNRTIGSSIKNFFYDSSLHAMMINERTGQLIWNQNDPEAIEVLV